MSHHTPGPWLAAAYAVAQPDMEHEDDICFVRHKGDGAHACGRRRIPDSTARANARLIAAAPELAAALHRYLELYQIRPGDISVQSEWGKCYVECEAAAKAALEKAGILGERPEFECMLEAWEKEKGGEA